MITPLNTQGLILAQLSRASGQNRAVLERLASGYIRPTDNVAGFALGSRLRVQNTELEVASRNLQQAQAVTGIAEGTLTRINSLVERARELAVQAGNGTLSNNDRASLNVEFQSVLDEIDRLAADTRFNGRQLLNGQQTASLSNGPAGLTGVSVSGVSQDIGATNNLNYNATNQTFTAIIGGTVYQGTLQEAYINEDTGYVEGNTTVRLRAQDGSSGSIVLDLNENFNAGTNAVADLAVEGESSVTTFDFSAVNSPIRLSLAGTNTTTLGLNDEDISTAEGANAAVAALNAALESVALNRADVGAIQNRLGTAIDNISLTRENYSAAQSAYLDADFLSNVSQKASADLMLKAGLSTLIQGNNLNRNFVLELLST